MTIYKKIIALLGATERKKGLLLVAYMLIGMVLEVVGISAVVPAIMLITKADFFQSYPNLKPYIMMIGNPSQVQLMVDALLFLVVIYVTKTFFFMFMAWKQNKFYLDVQVNLSGRLFLGYLQQPWIFHLQRNSADLIQNISNEVNIFTSGVLQPALVLMTEILVLLGVSSLLFMVQPLGALAVIGVLAVMGYGFQRSLRAYLLRLGKARQYYEGGRIKHLQQGLGGAKEVKLLGCEQAFSDLFKQANEGNARLGRKQRTLMELPRLWLELLAVTAMAVFVLVLVSQGASLGSLLSMLGLFAAAALRLMPSANRIFSTLQNLHFGLPAVDTLNKEIAQLQKNEFSKKRGALIFKKKIDLKQVYYQYPNIESHVLNNINITIERGAAVGFIGQSGAGKSTLIDIMLGLLVPSKGSINVDGMSIQGHLRDWQDQIGYVPQSIFLIDDSLRRNVAFGVPDDLIDENAVQKAIKSAQLNDFVKTLPNDLDTLVGERGVRLSGGQRQRIGIARALYKDPEILVLDEATSALDAATESEVMEAINALHGYKTLIIIAHRLSTVANCDYLYKMEQGTVVAEGSYNEVVNDKHVFKTEVLNATSLEITN